MKKIVILVLLVVAIISPVFSQATREQISMADREISRAEVDFKKAERNFDSQKAKQIAELKRDYRKQEIAGNRSDSKTEIDAALKATTKIQNQIDSISALTADANMYQKQQAVQKWQNKKAELLSQFLEVKTSKTATAKSDPVKLDIKKDKAADSADTTKVAKAAKEPKPVPDIYDRRIPTEVKRVSYNQRNRSYDLRREDLVLTKIEQNINSAISPAAPEGGYKVIFDNQYIEPVEFILRMVNGSVRKAVLIDPKVRATHYLLPGRYSVESYVNGRLSKTDILTVDGQTHDYKGESCFGFTCATRFSN